MSTPAKVQSCAVSWCAATATVGAHCPTHAKDATVHPQTLAADEEFAEDSDCPECDGSGDCENCYGHGECSCECFTCGAAGHDCGKCDGSGDCKHCKGTGKVTFKKKAE